MLEYWKKKAVNLVIGILDSLFVFMFAFNIIAQAESSIDRGRQIAHDHFKGNCLACHQMPKDKSAKSKANIAPALIDIKIKYPERNRVFLTGYMILHQSIQIQLCLLMEKIQFYQHKKFLISLIISTLYE